MGYTRNYIIKHIVTVFVSLIDDLFTIIDELHTLAHKWKQIGLALRLQPDALSNIRENKDSVEGCLEEMLTMWLKKVNMCNRAQLGDPSWKTLVEAVARPTGGGHAALAERITKKHIQH